MDCLRATIPSAKLSGIFNLPPALKNRRVQVIITPDDNDIAENIMTTRPFDKANQKCNIGCCPEVPELPDSFFDPLPEEELQAWEL